MNRYAWVIVLAMLATSPSSYAETSSATVTSDHAAGGLKALKNASLKDPEGMAVDLTSPEPRDRGMAAQALGRLGAAAHPALQTLVETLTDFATYRDDSGRHVVAVDAAQAVRQIDATSPIPPKTLTRIIRTANAPAEHQLVQGGWVSRCGAQADAVATLAALGPLAQSALPDLTRLNHKPCTEGRAFDAAAAIGPVGPEQLPRLEMMLNDADPEARRSVTDYIGETHLTGAAAALGRAMNDDSSAVRLAAMEALEKLHPEGEGRVPLVRPFLQNESPEIRRTALRFLMKLAPDSALTLSLLKDQLKDPDDSIVLEAAQAIARVQPRDRALLETLIRLAKDPDSETGPQAAEILKTSGSRDAKVAEALEPYREQERRQEIEKALATSTPEDRATNARTLRVNAIRIAKGIQEEQPDHAGRVFSSAAKRLFCWTAVSVDTAPAILRQVWYLDGKPVYETRLIVADTSSRVWSSRRIRPGKWRVDITTPGSKEPLASASFTVIKP